MTSRSHSPALTDYESADSQHDRPNRWLGPAKTWQNITAADRTVASSLDQARDRDLSVHLYNAHALKRKAREERDVVGEQGGQRDWRREVEDTKGFVPPKSWVAWPLQKEDVPRDVAMDGEAQGEDRDGLGRFTTKRMLGTEGDSGRVLEDVLVARTLKHAKDRFYKRMALEDEVEDNDTGSDTQGLQMEDDEDVEDARSPPRKNSKKSSKKHDSVEMIPVVSTDDNLSQELLRPSLSNTIAKLDEVLIALHHARSTCLQVVNEDSDSGTEIDPQQSQITPTKRLQGRVRKFEDARGAPTVAEFIAGVTKSNRGRPKKHIQRLDGETDENYAIRLAQIRRVPMPALAAPRGFASAKPVTPNRQKTPTADTIVDEARGARRMKRLELRDWSDVLGMAALVGFEESVIARATQRCAVLFGEGMYMRTMIETPSGESKDVLKSYDPKVLPMVDLERPLDYKDLLPEDNDIESIFETAKKHFCTQEGCTRATEAFRDERDLRRHMARIHSIRLSDNKSPRKLLQNPPPVSDTNQMDLRNLLCLVEGCQKAGKPYMNAYSLKRHFKRTHHISDPKEMEAQEEEFEVTRDEEMFGGVHVDGFLQQFNFPLRHVEHQDGPKKLRATKMANRSKFVSQDEEDEDEEGDNIAEDDEDGEDDE